MIKSKKSGAILFIKPGTVLVLGDRLINREIHLAAFDDLAVLDFPASVAKRGEHLVLGIVDQNVAVGEIENLRPAMFASPVPTRYQSFQQIWKATTVLPVPVAIVRRIRFFPCSNAFKARLMAIS